MLKDILKGINYYKGSFALMKQLKLWKFFAIPILISVVLAFGIVFSAWGLSDNVSNYLIQIWIWDWGKETMHSVFGVLGFILVLATGLLLYKRSIMAFSAPFMSPISEKIEAHITGNKITSTSSFTELLMRGIRVNTRNLLLEFLWTFLLFLFGIIPIIGIASTPVLILLQSYFSGFGNMDYTLERHFNTRQSIAFVKRNRGLAIGNGIVFALLLVIPVVGLIIALPLSVTAATRQTVDALNEEKLKK